MVNETKFEVMRDGKTIRGICYRPEGEGLPIAIVSHGFLANYKTTMHYAKQFADWGYAAYCFDFIGGGIGIKSDGKLSDMTVLTEKENLKAVIEFAKSNSYTDGENVTLMGCSQGGFVSAMVASDLKDEIKNLILFYPALCIPDDARKGKMMVFKFDPENIPDFIKYGPLKLSGDYARAVINMDPYKEISGYKGPVLLIHGDEDGIVNVSYARKAKETYGDNCTLQIIEGAHHMFSGKYDKIAIASVKEFLHIGE